MSEILIISLFLLSHVLADFYFPTDKLKNMGNSNLSILWHSTTFLLCSLILTSAFFNLTLFAVILIIAVFHFVINKIKISFPNDHKPLTSLLLLISEQLARIVIIVAAYPFLTNTELNAWANRVIGYVMMYYPFLEAVNHINLLAYIVLVAAAMLFSIRGGTELSLLIINLPNEKTDYNPKDKTGPIIEQLGRNEVAATTEIYDRSDNFEDHRKEELKRYGKVIGNIERLIIIFAMLINQYQLIALLVAIKSIGRFKELNNKTSDYYIVGTFASFSIAFLIGFILVSVRSMLLG
ncbi:hypothetical protein J2S00_000157 [Caldalkalibacillus uzonensis]|uniref:DUF3307 domain-containing protein n=1 Tax=Caldalkalibacillus uzonensis TaxID=353224 RepID=A0ABU0CLU5_9BACI|nr:DUF3307 domain-containing protein [Caldalkalibacillus uzonensis]MDQ0337387.1 hypothetical protein [Caldalkalibacillus uzonensis]